MKRAFGSTVEGEAVVSAEGFSPRYDLDRTSGVITKMGHALEGVHIVDKILILPSAKGGVAAGWAFFDLKGKGFAPKALIFGRTNPVMVQGAVFADMTITEGWTPDALKSISTGDWIRVDTKRRTIEVIQRAPRPSKPHVLPAVKAVSDSVVAR